MPRGARSRPRDRRRRAISGQLNYLADIYSARGDHPRVRSRPTKRRSSTAYSTIRSFVTNSTYNSVIAAWENGEVPRARVAFEDVHAHATEPGDIIHTTAADFMLGERDLEAGEPRRRRADGSRRRPRRLHGFRRTNEARAECLVVLVGISVAKGPRRGRRSTFSVPRAVCAATRLRTVRGSRGRRLRDASTFMPRLGATPPSPRRRENGGTSKPLVGLGPLEHRSALVSPG